MIEKQQSGSVDDNSLSFLSLIRLWGGSKEMKKTKNRADEKKEEGEVKGGQMVCGMN